MASYIDSILSPGERITYTGRTTNWIYALPMLITVPALVVAVLLSSLPLIAGALILGAVLLLFPFIRQLSTELVVTDRRVVAKFGLISRHTTELRISKIESIRIDQHFWERVGGYGTVILQGTGGADEPIPQVKDPLAFKKAVEEQLVAYEDADRTAPRST
jgi:uncharacterized membrane protein YdbT with pleckstrin-like domain